MFSTSHRRPPVPTSENCHVFSVFSLILPNLKKFLPHFGHFWIKGATPLIKVPPVVIRCFKLWQLPFLRNENMNEQADSPRMKIVLPKLSTSEINGLLGYCETKMNQGIFIEPCTWFQSILIAEKERRTRHLSEPEMLAIPNWHPSELSVALVCFYSLSRRGLTVAQAEVVDEICSHVVGSCASVLSFVRETSDAI